MVEYRYGEFNGLNKVKFHDCTLSAPEFYYTEEMLYRVENGTILSAVTLGANLRTRHTHVVDGKVRLQDNDRMLVDAPEGCDVDVQQSVINYLIDKETEDCVLLIPIHPDGSKDWIPAEESDLLGKKVRAAYDACKHLTGRERFEKMLPMLKDCVVGCAVTKVSEQGDECIWDAYGIQFVSGYQGSPKYYEPCALLMNGEAHKYVQHRTAWDWKLSSDLTVMVDKYVITDRPISEKLTFKSPVDIYSGDVLLVEIPDAAKTALDFLLLDELERLSEDTGYYRELYSVLDGIQGKLPPSSQDKDGLILQALKVMSRLV